MWLLMAVFLSVSAVAVEAKPRSQAFCLAAVFKGLVMANPSDAVWSPKSATKDQRAFLDRYNGAARQDLLLLPDTLVSALVTTDKDLLNSWFAEHGFPDMNIRIPGKGIAIGTVFDLLVDWQVPGKKKEIYFEREGGGYDHYQGVEMEKEVNAFSGFEVQNYNYPMFRLETRQGWQVYLVETDDQNIPDSHLPARARSLLAMPRQLAHYEKVSFPAVVMSASVDISWLKGLEVAGFGIDEAVKKIRLRLDDKGARAESAVAFVSRSASSAGYTIRRPFYVIFYKDGLNFPPFVALAAPDVWVKSVQ